MWLSQAYTDTDMIHHETLQFKGARIRTHVYTSAYAAQMPLDKCISHQPCSWAAVKYKANLGWRKWKDVFLEKPCVYQTRGLQFIRNDYFKTTEKLNNMAAVYILTSMFLCIVVKIQSRFALKCKPWQWNTHPLRYYLSQRIAVWIQLKHLLTPFIGLWII